MSSGSEILGTSRKTIETIVNYPNNYTSCPGIDKVCRFVESDCIPKEGSPYTSPYLRPSLDGVDYDSLPLGVISAFNEDFSYYSRIVVMLPSNVALVTSTIMYPVILITVL